MITLHVFSSMFPGGIGETRDMRVQWALEEMALPYRVRARDYAAGECDALAGVLREARDMEFLTDYPAVRNYVERALARPAWQRTRELTARRMGVAPAAIA